ncbi:hypothetical protein ACGFJT_37135 [Actinomadura geliboluensis]|uniref:hypothetical protein n=1 Tax=Actinomadura geliboluensis TaxID=882440 RepID=UPI003716CD27
MNHVAILTPEQAAESLTASASDIDQWSMVERRAFLRGLRTAATPLGAGSKWANLEGVIAFFSESQLGAPGTWVSWVNAGVLESVQCGIALALDVPGLNLDNPGHYLENPGAVHNPGAVAWAEYLTQLTGGRLTLPSQHAHMWSMAKEVSTEAGVHLAEHVHGTRPTGAERGFLQYARAYNWGMRNRPIVEVMLTAAGGLAPEFDLPPGFLDWFLDVGDPDAAQVGCEIAWELACRQNTRDRISPLSMFGHMVTHLPRLTAVYQASQRRRDTDRLDGSARDGTA